MEALIKSPKLRYRVRSRSVLAAKESKIVSSVAAYNKDGQLLFGKRNDTGKFTLPGGHAHVGEHPDKAAVRELFEESGLLPIEIEYIGQGNGGRNGDIKICCYKALVDGEPTGENDPDGECDCWDWVDGEEIPEEILENLHNTKNITLELLGLLGGSEEDEEEESDEKEADVNIVDEPHDTKMHPSDDQRMPLPDEEISKNNLFPEQDYGHTMKIEGALSFSPQWDVVSRNKVGDTVETELFHESGFKVYLVYDAKKDAPPTSYGWLPDAISYQLFDQNNNKVAEGSFENNPVAYKDVFESFDDKIQAANKNASQGGNLDDLTSPGKSAPSMSEISKPYGGMNQAEDDDLHLGTVEAPYSDGLGPVSVNEDDDKRFNVVRGASFFDLADRFIKDATVGNIVRILGLPKDVAEQIHEEYPQHDFAIAGLYKKWSEFRHIGGGTQGTTWKEFFSWPVVQSIISFILGDKRAETLCNKVVISNLDWNDLRETLHNYSVEKMKKTLPDMKTRAILTFPNGFYWVALKEGTEEGNLEGHLMQHCGTGHGTLYSLRDNHNSPHVTIDIADGELHQIRGKQNTEPNAKYTPYIRGLLDLLKITHGSEEESSREFMQSIGITNKDRICYQCDEAVKPFSDGYKDSLCDKCVDGLRDPADKRLVEPIEEKEAIALPDAGAVDENKYDQYVNIRQDSSIPRPSLTEDMKYK